MKTSKLFQRIIIGLWVACGLVLPVANALAANTTLTTTSTVLEPLDVSQGQQLQWGSVVQPSAIAGCTAYDVSSTSVTSTADCATASAPQDGSFLSGTGAQRGLLGFTGAASTLINLVFGAANCTALTGVTLTRLFPGTPAGRSTVLTLNSIGTFTWSINGTIEVLGNAQTGAFDCSQTVDVSY